MLTFDQAVQAAQDHHDTAARLHAEAVRALAALKTLAAEDSPRGAHARHALLDLAAKLKQ